MTPAGVLNAKRCGRSISSAARTTTSDDGQIQQDSFGMWVSLDPDQRGIATSVGSGIVARQQVAQLARVELSAVKLDLKLSVES